MLGCAELCCASAPSNTLHVFSKFLRHRAGVEIVVLNHSRPDSLNNRTKQLSVIYQKVFSNEKSALVPREGERETCALSDEGKDGAIRGLAHQVN